MAGPKTREAWVVYNASSGAVHALYFREPKIIPPGLKVVKAVLDERDIQQVHHLRVVGEKVVRYPALTGI